MQRSTVRWEHCSKTEWEDLQNRNQASEDVRGRNVIYNEATSNTEMEVNEMRVVRGISRRETPVWSSYNANTRQSSFCVR